MILGPGAGGAFPRAAARRTGAIAGAAAHTQGQFVTGGTRPARITDRSCTVAEFPAPAEGIVLTHFLVSDDVDRSRAFYTEVLGGEALMDGEPTIVALANSWIIINTGGGPTDDKPSVTLEAPHDLDRVSAFLNIRVADIAAVYADWSAKGAQFLTEPIDRGPEIRCYLRDPDGHLIEVGQSRR